MAKMISYYREISAALYYLSLLVIGRIPDMLLKELLFSVNRLKLLTGFLPILLHKLAPVHPSLPSLSACFIPLWVTGSWSRSQIINKLRLGDRNVRLK